MQPSVSSRSNVTATASRSAASSSSAGQVRVGGEHREHRGQRRGQHGGALGHAADRHSRALAPGTSSGPCRWCGSRPRPPRRRRPPRPRPRRPRRAAAGPWAAARRSGRSSRPRPPRPTPSSSLASRSAVWWVSPNPSGPVQALAPPELSTTARTRPPLTTCCVHSTGAALTRLAVNTPAAASDGPSLTTTARSRLAGLLDARRSTPAARNPAGAVTLMARLPWRSGRPSPAGRA